MHQSTCDLSDTYGGQARVLPSILRHFGGRTRFGGAIATVECFEDNSRLRELAATPGDGRILLVDGGGSTRCALLGDTIGKELLEHGWAGIVVHGCVRDTAALATLDLGVMALAATPLRSLKNGQGTIGTTVQIAGVAYTPGELLFADEDGVVVIAAAVFDGDDQL